MKEKEILLIFNKYKKQNIRLLGDHALYDGEIEKRCIELFGNKFQGVYSQDSIFAHKPGYYIFNTDLKSGSGIHWLGAVLCRKNAYLYDSFGRDLNKVVPILIKNLSKKYTVKFDTKDAEQKKMYKNEITKSCGAACIAFLQCVDKYGIVNAMKI